MEDKDVSYRMKIFDDLTPLELYQILQLRSLVFVVEQNCVYLDADDKDQRSTHLMISDQNGILLAYARLLPEGLSYNGYASIGRVVSHPEYRRFGWGRKIMEYALRECERLYPGIPIKISAQSYLLQFYQSMGFQPIGAEYLEDNIPHTAMIR